MVDEITSPSKDSSATTVSVIASCNSFSKSIWPEEVESLAEEDAWRVLKGALEKRGDSSKLEAELASISTGTLPWPVAFMDGGMFTGVDWSGRLGRATSRSKIWCSLERREHEPPPLHKLFACSSLFFFAHPPSSPMGLRLLKLNCGPIQSLRCGPTCVVISTCDSQRSSSSDSSPPPSKPAVKGNSAAALISLPPPLPPPPPSPPAEASISGLSIGRGGWSWARSRGCVSAHCPCAPT